MLQPLIRHNQSADPSTAGLCEYVRELGEVCGVEVQPPRQPLHQLRALASAEGPGGEKQAGVTFPRSSSK